MKYIYVLIIFSLINFTQAQTIDKGSFMPTAGKYIVSGWVKEIHDKQQAKYESSKIGVKILGITPEYNIEFNPSGSIIDGWQRIIGIVDIPLLPENVANINLRVDLICNNELSDCYFDDIRFFPYNGNLKSFVYDEETQRLMAELDENNYATYYEYDIEGGLIRIKKETEKGVFTIQETRSNTVKSK